MEENFYIKTYNKIQNSLISSKIKKKQVADKLGISPTALSNQFKNLREGNGINIKTLKVIEELTGINFFCF